MAEQTILRAPENYEGLDKFFEENGIHSIFLVCDRSLEYLRLNDYIDGLEDRCGIKVFKFSDFEPNPKYESVREGVRLFRDSSCNCIVAIGGGSAIDVAKCIKLYSSSECDGADGSYLKQPIVENKVKLLAIPTTAGTGSEATRYAVVYYEGNKQSITHGSIVPWTVLFDPTVLNTLPDYQKRSCVMDALCHAIESYWSINSTEKSKEYSKQAIRLITQNIDHYLAGDESKYPVMQEAAYVAGKAINITQTTAGHAMCYGLTSKYGISHGHAAALCVRELWPWMLGSPASVCIDERGSKYLKGVYREIAEAFGKADPMDGYREYQDIVDSLDLSHPVGDEADIEELTRTVNATRLSNHPVKLSEDDIRKLYKKIVW